MPSPQVTLFCDGASRGNPGPSSYGYVIYSQEQNQILVQKGEKLGSATNNIAEYQALIHGLKECISLGAKQVIVKSDSELLVRQLNGIYRIKNENLKPLAEEVKVLMKNFQTVTILHIPREENKLADLLANQALDAV